MSPSNQRKKLEAFEFVKSHGLSNDYLVVDGETFGLPLTPERIRQICNRNSGVGSDGILVLEKSPQADFGLIILNPDGSEAEKSGNGLRIFSKFLYDHGYTDKTKFSIHTKGGIAQSELFLENEHVKAIRVEMGQASINSKLTNITVGNEKLSVTSVSVGNPHCVVIVDDLSKVDFFKLGPQIENHAAFPNRTNVQFAQVLSKNAIKILIWERGAGHTLASGSSSCAAVTACYNKKLIDGKVTVHMEGGELTVEIDPNFKIVQTGPVEEICIGRLSQDLKGRLSR